MIGPLIRLAVTLGVLMLFESLGVLVVGWRWFALANDDGRLMTFAFTTLLFFALFSLVSIRERRAFWASHPSGVLTGALLADGCVGLLIAVFGLGELGPIPLRQIAFVFGCAAVSCLAINEVVKLVLLPTTKDVAAPLARSEPA
jgi:hypothetical protein